MASPITSSTVPNGKPVRGFTPGAVSSVNSSTSKRSASSMRSSVTWMSSRQVTNVTTASAASTRSRTQPMMRVRAVDGSSRRRRGAAAGCRHRRGVVRRGHRGPCPGLRAAPVRSERCRSRPSWPRSPAPCRPPGAVSRRHRDRRRPGPSSSSSSSPPEAAAPRSPRGPAGRVRPETLRRCSRSRVRRVHRVHRAGLTGALGSATADGRRVDRDRFERRARRRCPRRATPHRPPARP